MENTERTLAFGSCVRGYHVYKDLWIPVTNEELACRPHVRVLLIMGVVHAHAGNEN